MPACLQKAVIYSPAALSLSNAVSLHALFQGQADLLKYAKNETLENLKQIHYAAVSCGLNKPGTENSEAQKPRRSLEVIPEKASDENGD